MVDDDQIVPGAKFETKCLFVRDKVYQDDDVFSEAQYYLWRVGFHREAIQYGVFEEWCDGYGLVIHDVVAVVDMPKPYRKRVFFKRKFVDPDFGVRPSRGLMCCGIAAFKTKVTPYDEARGTEIIAHTKGEYADEFCGEFDFDKWLADYKAKEAA